MRRWDEQTVLEIYEKGCRVRPFYMFFHIIQVTDINIAVNGG